MIAYTDYPFEILGDKIGQKVPIRECQVIEYDGDKYCSVIVEGHLFEIKVGYIYKNKCSKEIIDTEGLK